MDPASIQAQILAWIGVSAVVIAAVSAVAIKVAGQVRSVADAWGVLAVHKKEIGAVQAKVQGHEQRLNGGLDARMRVIAEEVTNARIALGAPVAGAWRRWDSGLQGAPDSAGGRPGARAAGEEKVTS